MGVFAYVILGTIPESCVGPTAVTSLMTIAHTKKGGAGICNPSSVSKWFGGTHGRPF